MLIALTFGATNFFCDTTGAPHICVFVCSPKLLQPVDGATHFHMAIELCLLDPC